MKYTLKNENIESYNESDAFSFPKYTSQLINWANQNAQGTRPVVVGQMSELFPEFMASGEKITIENWRNWYVERFPDAFEKATEKIYAQVQNLRDAIPLIDREMVKYWVEDLVIAIDTSMSTSGEQVRKFLESTYSILRSSETFTRRFNIRILQCDDRLRRDDTVRDLRELKEYMEDFKLVGGSSTDFRPVFDYVEKLRAEGRFTQLRGLIYFTDGMGTYPKLPTPYETAFIMLQPPPIAIEFPPWAIRLILGEAALERAWEDVSDAVEYLTELPEL